MGTDKPLQAPTIGHLSANQGLTKSAREQERLDKTVRQNKNKDINKIRSKMKNGEWHYEYLD